MIVRCRNGRVEDGMHRRLCCRNQYIQVRRIVSKSRELREVQRHYDRLTLITWLQLFLGPLFNLLHSGVCVGYTADRFWRTANTLQLLNKLADQSAGLATSWTCGQHQIATLRNGGELLVSEADYSCRSQATACKI